MPKRMSPNDRAVEFGAWCDASAWCQATRELGRSRHPETPSSLPPERPIVLRHGRRTVGRGCALEQRRRPTPKSSEPFVDQALRLRSASGRLIARGRTTARSRGTRRHCVRTTPRTAGRARSRRDRVDAIGTHVPRSGSRRQEADMMSFHRSFLSSGYGVSIPACSIADWTAAEIVRGCCRAVLSRRNGVKSHRA